MEHSSHVARSSLWLLTCLMLATTSSKQCCSALKWHLEPFVKSWQHQDGVCYHLQLRIPTAVPRGPSPGPPAPAQGNNSDVDVAFSESTLGHYAYHTNHFGSRLSSKLIIVLMTWVLLKSRIWITLSISGVEWLLHLPFVKEKIVRKKILSMGNISTFPHPQFSFHSYSYHNQKIQVFSRNK